MILDDKRCLSDIVKIAIVLRNKTLFSLSETLKQEFDTLLNVAQGIVFGLIENLEADSRDIPLSARPFTKIKKEYENYQIGEEKATENTKNILKDLILNNEQIYHNLIGCALFEKNTQENNHFNELFVCKLASKYKNIGEQDICVVFKKEEAILVMTDGETYICDFPSFVTDFFGGKNEEIGSLYLELKKHLQNNRLTHFDLQEKINELCNKIQEKINEDYSLAYGAVMFCDFLGWKGLWKNNDEPDALKKANSLVEDIRKTFYDYATKTVPLNKYFPVSELISISDTIATMMPMVN